jgi:hypothetical protein
MSSSSISSTSSTSSTDTTFPSSAPAASRMRKHRRNAISRQAESEWDAPAPTPFPNGWTWTDSPTTILPPPDELVCPLAPPLPPFSSSSPFSSFTLSHVDASLPGQHASDGDADGSDDLQATLARFAFPSPTRKHRRSGESILHHSTIPPPSGATRGCGTSTGTGTGLVKRARCAHCEHARTSV